MLDRVYQAIKNNSFLAPLFADEGIKVINPKAKHGDSYCQVFRDIVSKSNFDEGVNRFLSMIEKAFRFNEKRDPVDQFTFTQSLASYGTTIDKCKLLWFGDDELGSRKLRVTEGRLISSENPYETSFFQPLDLITPAQWVRASEEKYYELFADIGLYRNQLTLN